MLTLAAAILLVIVIGGFPALGLQERAGYYPSGLGLVLLLVVLFLIFRGRW